MGVVTRHGPARRAANRTIAALVGAGVLDRARDAAAVDRLQTLATAADDVTSAPCTTACPECGTPVPTGPDTVALVRVSRELRAWWEAIRARKEGAAQGVSISDLFADLDADLRADAPQPD